MNKFLKWLLILSGSLIGLVIVVILVTPMFFNVQKYKSMIEEKGTEITGRQLTLGGDIDLSLFPWVGVSITDLHLGNPSGFEEKELLSIKTFEVRVKLLPLLSRDIQVKRFLLDGVRVVLEKNKKGQGNWEGFAKQAKTDETQSIKKEESEQAKDEGIPIKALAVKELSLTGSLLWIDNSKGVRKEVSDLSLKCNDLSFDNPVKLALSAKIDGKPISLAGKIGPVGKNLGEGKIPLDILIKALNELEMKISGEIEDVATRQQYNIDLQISEFSPRKLMAAVGQELPIHTSDPNVLNKVSLKSKIKGSSDKVEIENGVLGLDDSKIALDMKIGEFKRPNLYFKIDLDKIDLDRYMPPTSEKEEKETGGKTKTSKKKKTDYSLLRQLILDGSLKIGQLKAKNIKIQDMDLKVKGKDGILELNKLVLKLYEGKLSTKGVMDVRQDTPKTQLSLDMKGVSVGPLMHDFMSKDFFLEGTTQSKLNIKMRGDDPEVIKKSLNGKGNFLFTDGAIVGIDLAGMVRNAKATFGLAEKSEKKPRTDFSELKVPFTISKGVVKTTNTSMKSPLIRVLAAGKADLVKENLDFRVEPKFVATIKGQGDAKSRSGIVVPVLVTGPFTSPKFKPDLEGMIKGNLEKTLTDPNSLKELVPIPGGSSDTTSKDSIEEKAKGILKSLPFGQQ